MTDSGPRLPSPIDVSGETDVTVTEGHLTDAQPREREVEVNCASGRSYTAVWRGIALTRILEVAGIPAGTTHLLVRSADSYQVCVEYETAADGVLAIARGGEPLSQCTEYETRLVAEGLEGSRMTKDVAAIEVRSLSPEMDPENDEED